MSSIIAYMFANVLHQTMHLNKYIYAKKKINNNNQIKKKTLEFINIFRLYIHIF
jgi:hypothetical protein